MVKLYKNEKELYCLMSNEHIVTKEMVEAKVIIDVKYDMEEKWIKIKLDKRERFIKYDEFLDYIIIEIIMTDKIKDKFFLIPNINKNIDYINREIYIVQYPNGGQLSYSEGIIKGIKNNELIHNADTKFGSSGSPIFLKDSKEVIGMHKLGDINKNENYGILIQSILQILQSRKDSLINKQQKIYVNNDYNSLQMTNNSMYPVQIPLINQNIHNYLPLNNQNINSVQSIQSTSQNNFYQNLSSINNIYLQQQTLNRESQQNVVQTKSIQNQSSNIIQSNFMISQQIQNPNIKIQNQISQSPDIKKQTHMVQKSPPKNILKEERNNSSPIITKTNDREIISRNYNTNLYNNSEENQKSLEKLNNKAGKGFRYIGDISKSGRNENGQIKINQDKILIHPNVGDIPGINLFGIFDGHGPHGHFISQFCHNYFIEKIDEYINQCKKEGISTPDGIYNRLKRTNYLFIKELFKNADIEISKQNKFDYNFSGTTCSLVFQFNKYLVCAYVGDSRVIIISDDFNNTNQNITPLSRDHKPDLPQELERILLNGGRVDKTRDQYGNKIGPYRVFKHGLTYPGLNISRSLGDFNAKECGVINIPEIIEFKLSHNSRYMVIGSTGIWEILSNEQVRDLVNPLYIKGEIGSFIKKLVQEAVKKWEQRDIIREDITAIGVFFK